MQWGQTIRVMGEGGGVCVCVWKKSPCQTRQTRPAAAAAAVKGEEMETA